MLSVAQAQHLVLQHTQSLPPEQASLADCVGRALAEDIMCDADSPPFSKSMVDGYAIRAADVSHAPTAFQVIEEVHAGHMPQKSLRTGKATRIMTGAAIPTGADAVVMHEKTRTGPSEDSVLIPGPVLPHQNVFARGEEMKRGEMVLQSGQLLRPATIGLLATLGRKAARIIGKPSVAVLSTGDELVEPGESVREGQIRNSNGPMMMAQLTKLPCISTYLGIGRDTRESLRPLIEKGLQGNVLIITGGVSAGNVDLVPHVLTELGMEPIFHKVAMKPGKPVLFGKCDKTLVFGLPGNPVSGLVGCLLFVMPALRKLLGWPEPYAPESLTARLTIDYRIKSDRPTYVPVSLTGSGASLRATPRGWRGSADLRSAALADGFALFPPGEHQFTSSDELSVIPV